MRVQAQPLCVALTHFAATNETPSRIPIGRAPLVREGPLPFRCHRNAGRTCRSTSQRLLRLTKLTYWGPARPTPLVNLNPRWDDKPSGATVMA